MRFNLCFLVENQKASGFFSLCVKVQKVTFESYVQIIFRLLDMLELTWDQLKVLLQ